MKNRKKKAGITAAALVVVACGSFLASFFTGISGLHLNKKPESDQIKVACVGDSITYGHGISNWPKNNYPAVLGKMLGDKYNVSNFGVSGSTVQSTANRPYIKTKCYRQSLDYNADILILMMGTNDSKPENWQGSEKFRSEYTSLIEAYLNSENPPEIYLCTPAKPYSVNDKEEKISFDINAAQVEEIADTVRQTADEFNLQMIDIYNLTSNHPEWFEKDGVHPDVDGAAAIAEAVYSAVF